MKMQNLPPHAQNSGMRVIRSATLGDAESVRHLLDQLGYPQTIDVVRHRIQIYNKKPDYFLTLAEQQGIVVGLIALIVDEYFAQNARRCRVEALVVDKNHRKNGIGSQLIAHAEQIARSHECSLVELISGMRRAHEGTHLFYRNRGYANDGVNAWLYLQKAIVLHD